MDEWRASDYARLAVMVLVVFFSVGALCLACRNDMRAVDAREECRSKGGVWYRDERVCLDVKTIPLKEP